MTRLVTWTLLLAALLLPLSAFAQGDQQGSQTDQTDQTDQGDQSGQQSSGGLRKYVASGYGFEISLPDVGTVTDPKSPDWSNESEVALEWTAQNTPVVLIQARVDDLGDTVDPDIFQVFCKSLRDNWASDPDSYKIVNEESDINVGNYHWNLLEIEDHASGKGNTVYYSVFSTYQDSKIYTVSLYYLQPTDKAVRDFGKPVLQSFHVL
jgi:hypothetical protein